MCVVTHSLRFGSASALVVESACKANGARQLASATSKLVASSRTKLKRITTHVSSYTRNKTQTLDTRREGLTGGRPPELMLDL